MPFTRRQVARILEPDLIDTRRVPHLALRLTETYLRRKLYAWEDQAVTQQWALFDRTHQRIQDYAIRQANTLGIDTLGRTITSVQWRQAVQAFADAQITAAVQQTAVDAFRASLTAWYAGYYGKAWQLDVSTHERVPVRIPTPDHLKAHQAILLPDMREAVEPDANLYDGLGVEWREAFEAEAADMRLRVRRAMRRAAVDEASIMAALLLMREGMGLADTPAAGFKQSFYRIQTLTRTAIVDGLQDGAESLWHANSPQTRERGALDDALGVLLLSQVRWVTARDERVCPICRGLDGQVSSLFDFSRPRPPAHPNCRCGELPVILESLLIPPDTYPAQTLPEWLAGVGGGLLLDDFLNVGLASSQL